MEFRRIFDKVGRLCSVCYPEDKAGEKWVPVFHTMFDRWVDTEYLEEFFHQYQHELHRTFWDGMTIDEAIDRVLDEQANFFEELRGIDLQVGRYKGKSFNNVFMKLHKNIYSINWSNENQKKARPNARDSMIRIYATILDDGTYVVTGGTLKLTLKMEGERFERQMQRLQQVEAYIQQEKYLLLKVF